MNCPLCFSEAGPGFNLTLEEVEEILDHLVATEGNPEVVQFSGGEPTIHPEIVPMMRAAQDRGIANVMLNTNGKRIATDDRFLAELREIRPNIYFQFDGFESETYRIIRGEPDILPKKLRALDRLAEVGCTVILVPAIERGVNEHEIGRIVRFRPGPSGGEGYQFPASVSRRAARRARPYAADNQSRYSADIEDQTEGMFRVTDFVPVPCCFPTCNSVTYAYIDEQQQRHSVAAHFERRRLSGLHLESRDAGPRRGNPAGARRIVVILGGVGFGKGSGEFSFSCSACGLPEGGLDVKGLSNFMFMIMLQDFMDAWTFNQKNLMKCCKEFLLPGGQQIPFCAYNTVGYREQARAQLVAQEGARRQARRAGVRYQVQPVTFRFPSLLEIVK